MMDGDSDNESDFEFVQDEFRNDLDDQDMPRVNRIWINVPDADLFQFPDEIQTFSRPMGPVRALTPDVNANPIDYFNSLVTPSDSASLMELLVRETNRYAEQFLSDPGYDPKPNSRSHDWHETDIEEMSAYIGLILSMGILKKPSIESYWQEKESTWLFQTPGFSAVMRRDRFQLISKFLHCNDNTTYIPRGQDGYDPCHKFRPVLDLVNKTFPKAYNLARDLTVDESMVGFKGRNDIVQYVPAKKSHQWGAKFFVLCESDTGYNVSLELYTVNAYVIYIQNRGLRTKITRVEFVMDLCRGLVGMYREDRGRPGRPRAIAMRRLTERHFIEMIEGKKRKRCTLCSKKIRTWCPSCGVGLCLTTCFKAFHTVGNVSRHGLEE
ncbi:hypothetical protein FSP39_023714 [Pinctada imbricata]|uniref:PiggyBac transposable element-derived protein domain-containing protein n=1 Tax=Pinctada imbricata TaxID=66713 RepID=A0AA88YFK2_PINIB|nr:hypothetical protein FSP39_023714 [Pinctada imbricata]